MIKREAEFQGRFTRWLKSDIGRRMVREDLDEVAVAWELKTSQGSTLAFSKIPEHQIVALMQASGSKMWGDLGPLVHKLSDAASGFLPHDCYSIDGGGGYFALAFFVGTASERVFLVDVEFLARAMYATTGGIVERRRGSLTLEWTRGCGREVVGV